MTDREYMENKVRHAFNKGYDVGFKDGKEKAKPQEPILDKIRAEIEREYNRLSATRADETLELGECLGLKMSLKIIDKYKTESEE